MKTFLSIILASMILFFSAGLKVATHYCGDMAVSSSLTTDGFIEGCGMDKMDDKGCNSEGPLATKKNCCSDQIISLEIQDEYQSSEKANVLNLELLTAFIQVFIVNHYNGYEEIEFKDYSPPLVQQNVLIEHQTFLI
jgi:hypothetical protein